MGSDRAEAAPAARVVLLGASNVARGMSSAVETARSVLGVSPVEFLVAKGHGRSYGESSRVLGRRLSGITECGLWERLTAVPVKRTVALVTDVGNDIAYGVDPATIAGWVEECLMRLRAVDAEIAMTLLPMASLDRLGPVRFHVAKALLFPGRPITVEAARTRSRELHERLAELGARHGVAVVEQEGRWFGLDPVHVRLRDLPEACAMMMAPWASDGALPGLAGRGSPAQRLRLQVWRPAEWAWLGLRLGQSQPAGRLSDGSEIWLF
jgi:Fe2+ transport system protein FeoA